MAETKVIKIPAIVPVKEFAERAELSVSAVIGQLMKNGVLATINETIDFDTASIIGDDLGLSVELEEADLTPKSAAKTKIAESKNAVLRPPVVTVMGHVDHGKTTLLDKIRGTYVVQSESGGITQHISAYQLTLQETKRKDLRNRTITFIDTPGHAAFSALRGHGAAITDIVVLIVAADDGVMPQTVEVIEHAKQNNVPVIVAINKTDLPDADLMKVKKQLSDHGLVPEDWGGKTVMVPISAKSGAGVDDLLEMILLQADIMDLKANPDADAVGVVIESHMQKGAGPMAIVLIENGTLVRGKPIAIGSAYGKARILEDFAGRPIDRALPSQPARIAGLKSLPDFGDKLIAFSSDKEARENAFLATKSSTKLSIATAKRTEGEESEKKPEFKVIIKCDVGGSLEAVKKSIAEIQTDLIDIKIISEGVGAISESDVSLATATQAIVLGFRVQALGAAKRIAGEEKVDVAVFDIIYKLVDYLKAKISEVLPPEIIEEELARGEVLAIFRDDKKGFVAGGRIDSGKLTANDEIKFLQDQSVKYTAKISSLRKEKSEVKECEIGECGFGLPVGAKVAVGDKFIAFRTIHKKRTIQ